MALTSLNKDVLLSIWPPNRILAGLACCKKLRAVLMKAERIDLCLNGEGRSQGERQALTALLQQLEGDIFVSVSLCSTHATLQHLEDALLSGWAGPAGLQITKPSASARFVQAASGLAPLKETLQHWEQLRSLNLSGLGMGIAGAQELACAMRALAAPEHLETLELGQNNISDVGLTALVEALQEKKCTALRHLGLALNEITEEGVACLARLLPNLRQLESLGLGQNRIWDAGMGPLVAAWKEGPELRSLDLGGNRIGEEGAGLLAGVGACGRRSGALTRLDLSYNRLEAGESTSLAALLRSCPNLQTLDLAHNGTGRGGGGLEAVAGALGGCRGLRRVGLGGNDLDDRAAVALAGAVVHWPALQELSVRSNKIRDPGLAALLLALPPSQPRSHPQGVRGGVEVDCAFNGVSLAEEGPAPAALLLSAPRLSLLDLSYNPLPVNSFPPLAPLPALTLRLSS